MKDQLALLNHIDDNHNKIITGDQIAMEYKKNRQRVIVQCLNSLKKPNWQVLDPPAFLFNAQPAKIISREKKEIEKQSKKLKQTIEKVLRNPCRNDNVDKILQRLFKDKYPYNLTRENKVRFSIRRLARKRFILGYPPRKDNDTSIGDAINWEWIIHCSKESGKDVVIVSRDKDYGKHIIQYPRQNRRWGRTAQSGVEFGFTNPLYTHGVAAHARYYGRFSLFKPMP